MSPLPSTVDDLIARLLDQLEQARVAVPHPPAPRTPEQAAAALFSIAKQTKASLFSVWVDEIDEELVAGVSFFFALPDAPNHEGLLGTQRQAVRQHFELALHPLLTQAIADLARRGLDPKRPGRGTVSFPSSSADPDLVFRVTFVDGPQGSWVTAAARTRETRAAFPRFADLPLSGDEAAFLEETFLSLDTLFRGQMVLFTGERGSGRGTTFHAAMEALPDGVKALAALAQPRALDLRVGMTRIGPGLPLANALRAFLRQDPDLVFTDAARTPEELQFLAQAALTGHGVAFVLEAKTPEAAFQQLREAMPDVPLSPLIVHHVHDTKPGAGRISVHGVSYETAGEARVVRWSPW